MYDTHEMSVTEFDGEDAYVMSWASDGEEGEDQYSIPDEPSDI